MIANPTRKARISLLKKASEIRIYTLQGRFAGFGEVVQGKVVWKNKAKRRLHPAVYLLRAELPHNSITGKIILDQLTVR